MDGPPGVACMDTRHPRRLLAPEQVLMRFSIIYDRPSASRHAQPFGLRLSARRFAPLSTLRAFQALALSMSASPSAALLSSYEEPLLTGVRFYSGGQAQRRLAEMLRSRRPQRGGVPTSDSRRLERAD